MIKRVPEEATTSFGMSCSAASHSSEPGTASLQAQHAQHAGRHHAKCVRSEQARAACCCVGLPPWLPGDAYFNHQWQ